MTNVELMLKAVESNPDDLTAVWSLTEALMEERDMTRSEADRFAERAVQSVLDVRDLAVAADLMKAEQPWHAELIRDIRDHCHLSDLDLAQILLTPGEAPPRFSHAMMPQGECWWLGITVLVGARWLISYYRRNPSLWMQCPEPTRRRRRSR